MPAGDFGKTEDSSFYANSNVIEGEKGVLLTMSRTMSSEAIIVHYYYNF